MNMIEMLPEKEVDQFIKYVDENSEAGVNISENTLLRYWNEEKQDIFRAFGEQFILKKEVFLPKSKSDGAEEINREVLFGPTIIQSFISNFRKKIFSISDTYYHFGEFIQPDIYWDMRRIDYMLEAYTLYDNIWEDSQPITIDGRFTKNGKPFVIKPGCKIVKMIGKLVDVLDINPITKHKCKECGEYYETYDYKCPVCGSEEKILTTGYEEFRQAHSRVLNTKRVKGTLCLSIHPMDYVTMSDNACGWDSCMAWMNDNGGGEYRLGTIEMMNSPYVIVAYLESNRNHLSLWENGTWNSKKWRQLYIVTKDIILGNRQYPYDNEDLQGAAIKWLREIFNKAPGYGPYPEETSIVHNTQWNTFGEKRVNICYSTTFMYNDVYGDRLGYVATQNFEEDEYWDCNFSGQAICVHCGRDIYDDADPQRVCCRDCCGGWQCDCCGEWHMDCDSGIWMDDSKICQYCYEDHAEYCEICEEYHFDSRMEHVYLQIMGMNHHKINNFNYSFHVPICEDCIKYELYKSIYGKLHSVKDAFGYCRKAFDIREINEEKFDNVMRCGNLSRPEIDLIKKLRETQSEEEAVELLTEAGY